LHDKSSEQLMLWSSPRQLGGKGAADPSSRRRGFEGVDSAAMFLAISMSKAEGGPFGCNGRNGSACRPSRTLSDRQGYLGFAPNEISSGGGISALFVVPPIEVCLPVKGSERRKDIKKLTAIVC